eukprot:CAMPEP_0198310676 /NCGR_PEP_ID=MMETSP1450-20131203/2665_1 /TAXON_ID=753684 ORGANISM="Madagascaria erythrocladiodes, Strain CCMP3234" /NCGR_SAMPLE_ID=MMETSP1450 /ASSEMBLY_ACC=CAM_ASM_001115 /LENGTH=208 /DNA_ID=CAMNT_0044013519 /DNA_START=632 /DNA_END=1256 /DNA_ORIENTATION=+
MAVVIVDIETFADTAHLAVFAMVDVFVWVAVEKATLGTKVRRKLNTALSAVLGDRLLLVTLHAQNRCCFKSLKLVVLNLVVAQPARVPLAAARRQELALPNVVRAAQLSVLPKRRGLLRGGFFVALGAGLRAGMAIIARGGCAEPAEVYLQNQLPLLLRREMRVAVDKTLAFSSVFRGIGGGAAQGVAAAGGGFGRAGGSADGRGGGW